MSGVNRMSRRGIWSLAAALVLGMTSLGAGSAQAANDQSGQSAAELNARSSMSVRISGGSWVQGMAIPGSTGWLGTWVPYSGQPIPGLCIQADAINPSSGVAASPGDLTAQPGLSRPSDLSVDISQMAYIMKKWMPTSLDFSDSNLDAAAVALLAHVNFESSAYGAAASQANVNELLNLAPGNIQNRARAMVSEAKSSGAVAWEPGTVTGEGTRFGTIDKIGIKNSANAYIPGHPYTVTLNGPAVFDATGTQTLTGTTAADAINSLKWHSTGNGKVSGKVRYDNLGATSLSTMTPGGGHQTVIYDAAGMRSETANLPTWDVIFDFQPRATSNVGKSKVVDAGKLSDTITASADPTYGDGQWVKIDGTYVPVTFEGTAYYTGETPAAESTTVPEGAKVVGTTTITATGPGEYTATISGDYDPSFVTWVWKVVKADQTGTISGVAISDLVHADWADHFGLAEETSSIRHEAEVDSTMTTRESKSGTYLVDDLWVTGLPSDHPSFTGGSGFKADAQTFTQTLLFFPEDLEVTEANAAKAEKIATVTVPAKNGFYPSVGSTEFKMKDGAAGTYVFVTSFAGDDRVKAFTSSVEDTTEQYTVVPAQPTLKTTATDASDGDKVLPNTGTVSINDEVCYTNLTVGKEYTLTGTLMDKSTGKPLQADGKDLTGTTTFTPTKKDDCTTVTFTTDAKWLAGKTTVVFETLSQDDKTIAVHTDINDEGQTVTTPDTPTLKTTATDGVDGDKTVTPARQVTINDKVCYTNLTVGTEYTLDGTLMDKSTQAAYQVDGKDVTASTTFTPTKADDCTTVTFTFDGSALAGKSLVVFEQASQGDTLVATHTDITDEGQTVTFNGGDSDNGGAATAGALPVTGGDVATVGGIAALLAAAGISALALKRKHA